MDEDMKALDAYFERVEKLLSDCEMPDKMDRELRDAVMFYTAHQVRNTNGQVRANVQQLRLMWWVLGVVVVAIATLHGLPLLPLP